MKVRALSIIPLLLFAVHGFADEPVSRDAPLAEIEPAAEEEGSGSEPAEEILITLRVPLLAPLSPPSLLSLPFGLFWVHWTFVDAPRRVCLWCLRRGGGNVVSN